MVVGFMLRPWMRTLALAALLGCLGVACIGEDPQKASAPSNAEDQARGDSCKGQAAFVRSPMRRLTRAEFDFAVEDLLGLQQAWGRTALPIDEVTAGFANNAVVTVQPAHVQDFQDVARKVAEHAVENLDQLLACAPGRSQTDCVRAFVTRFARQALRRGVDPDEVQGLLDLYEQKRERAGHTQGVRLVIESVLQYPEFMYRAVVGTETETPGLRKLTAYELATRLAFFLWASVPDDELLAAAESGALNGVQGIRQQAERMLNDDRFLRALDQLSLQWLDMGETAPAKDPTEFPTFSPQLWASARKGVSRFFSDVVRDGGTLQDLLWKPVAYADERLAPLYGATVSGEALQVIDVDQSHRTGLLMQAGVMQALGTSEVSRPIKRGLFIRNHLLCQDPPPPPPDGIPPADSSPAPQTTRERLEAHRSNPSCASCHAFFDPLGLAFEHFDGLGRFRTHEGGRIIDASGALTETDVDGAFSDAVEMMSLLKDSDTVARCVATQVVRFALARLDEETDACSLEQLNATFADKDMNLRELFLATATSDVFRFTGTP